MIDALYNGISGLNVYQKALNVESNNIANVNTVSYKSDKTSFVDMMYQNGFGKGGAISTIEKDFTQGNIKATSSNYDMAILGEGYFQVKNISNETYYTRAGNFRMSSTGFLENSSGLKIQGLTTEAPTVVGTNANINTLGDLHTEFLATKSIVTDNSIQTINTKATNFKKTAMASGVSGDNYKTASAKLSDITTLTTEYQNRLNSYSLNAIAGTPSVAQISTVAYNPTLLTNDQDTMSIYVNGEQYRQPFIIDNTTTLNKFADQISTIKGLKASVDTATGILTVESLVPGQSVAINDAKINATVMLVNNTTESISGTGLAALTSSRDALKTAIENAGGEFIEISNNINLTNQNTLTLTDIQLELDSLNLSDTKYGDIELDNGNIYMKEGNNKFIIGKVVTSMFSDSIGLNPQGDNLYAQTKISGAPIYSASSNTIKEKALELSNSSLSEGLVNLMIFQKSFEANSKSITTSDELLKTAIQLKK